MEPTPANPYTPPATAGEGLVRRRSVRVKTSTPLPRVCAVCGAPATLTLNLKFAGGWGELWRVLRQQVHVETIRLPVCVRHRNFRRYWPHLAPLVFIIGFCLLAELLNTFTHGLVPALGMLAVFAVWCLLAAWYLWRVLRVRGFAVSHTTFDLVGVAPEFAAACRAGETGEPRARR